MTLHFADTLPVELERALCGPLALAMVRGAGPWLVAGSTSSSVTVFGFQVQTRALLAAFFAGGAAGWRDVVCCSLTSCSLTREGCCRITTCYSSMAGIITGC